MYDFLCLKDGHGIKKIPLSELKYVESAHQYVRFVTIRETVVSIGSISQVELLLPENRFIRIHRCYIVSCKAICHVEKKMVRLADKELPIGRKYRDSIWEKMILMYSSIELVEGIINSIL